MLETNRRGNLVWGFLMGLAALLFLYSGTAAGLVALTAIGVVLVLMMLAAMRDNPRPVRPRLQRLPTTTAARRARQLASDRPDFDKAYALQDVGLLIDEVRADGLRLQRARLVSMDDEAIRPYTVVNAPRYGHPAQVLVRFEINDASGDCQFVYEMDYYMRPGENAILPDYRLPLKGNDRLDQTGRWDVQVWINGGLVAIHTFSVSPSLEDRRRQFGVDGEAQQRLELESEPVPLSLEELLAQQSERS